MSWLVTNEQCVRILAVDFERDIAVLKDALVNVTTYIDRNGDETDDLSKAVAFVAGHDDIGWVAAEVNDFRYKPC